MREDRRTKYTKPLKVLAVEDNQIDKKVLESMLTETKNCTSFLEVAGSLTDAVKLLEKHVFDVVILDLNLPDCQGEATLKELNQRFPQVPIVVNTGAYEEELGLQAITHGAQDFLVKGKYSAYVLNKVLHYSLERKRLETDLLNTLGQLRDTQTQLIQAEKMKVVGGLASGVAHEVKNPLATILYGITYLFENIDKGDEKIKIVLDNIKEASERANTIITDLLDFSSLTTLNKEKQNLNDIIEKALILIHHEIDCNHIKLVKKLDKKIPDITVDKNRIEQVIINLLLNAIYAMDDGGQLTVKTDTLALSKNLKEIPDLQQGDFKPGDKVVICSIEDVGCGIPEDKLDKIFDPFFTTRRGRGGVGLGLSVSRNIIEIHQGGLFLENRKGRGTRARVVLKV